MSELYISMYHYTRDLVHSRYDKIKGLDRTQFREQIEYMKENFNIVSMEQVIDAVERKIELPEKALLLTFDDGYIDNYTVAFPILEEMGVQGSFFIPGKTFVTHQLLDVNKIHFILASAKLDELVADVKKAMDYYRGREFEFAETEELYRDHCVANRFDDGDTVFVKRMLQTVLPERLRNTISSELFEKYVGVTEEQFAYELYMHEEQIRLMKRHGMHIGIHGYDHYWLANLKADDLEKDVSMAVDALEPFIDRDKWVMNYPYGNYSEQVIECVKRHGACLGLSTEVRVADTNNDNPLALPRLDCNDFPPRSINYTKYV